MSKKLKRIVLATIFVMIICLIFLYEVHISYNKLTTNNYFMTTNQINNSVNLVIMSEPHDNH